MIGPSSGLALLSVAGLVSGLAASLRARQRPGERTGLEIAAGLLLAAGLFLTGLGLPLFR